MRGWENEARTSAEGITKGLDFEASRLGLGQRRGENVEEVQGEQ